MNGPQQIYLVDVQVVDALKRYTPSKHYVYSIWTIWSDGRKQLIFRRYSQFFDLQCKLLDRFKNEAGEYNPAERVIPFLPGKVIFGRSAIKSVALDRLHPLDIYCKKLISLKKEIATCNIVIDFFSLNNDDVNQSTKSNSNPVKNPNETKTQIGHDSISKPLQLDAYICIHDYKALNKTELSLRKNAKVYVVEKNLNGWWFVDSNDGQGYVPNCILRIADPSKSSTSSPIKLDNPEQYIVTKDYHAKKYDEISLRTGEYIYVREKNFNGWWRVFSNDGRVGLAPAVYLKPFKAASINDANKFAITTSQLFSANLEPPSNSAHSNPRRSPTNNTTSYGNSFDDGSVRFAPPREDFLAKWDTESTASRSQVESSWDHAGASWQPDQFSLTSSDSFMPVQIENGELYYAVDSYVDSVGDGVSLTKGEEVYVFEKNATGWWYVRLSNSVEGWAPSAFLAKEKPKREPPPRPKPPVIKPSSPTQQVSSQVSKPLDPVLNHIIENKIQQNQLQFELNPNNSQTNEQDSDYQPVKVSEMRKMFEKK